ncbi:cation-translocating P-type ATPase [Eubacteriales bacterium OttesenSCG-928-N14]|nr:cation-translocating P-type ATPase [Eubacteriales bacterium OttesenSCG-928-N14]
MIKKVFEVFSGIPATVVAGIFLLASLVLMLTDTALAIDPAWVTVIISGFPLLYLAITRVIFEGNISSALLISIAMIASIAIGELFAAGEVAFIMAIGAILEEKTTERARKGITQLMDLAPSTARILCTNCDGISEQVISVELVALGDVVRVLPGETIPVDGMVLSGNTSVDQSVITGESLPVDIQPGNDVFAGTINRFGVIDIRTAKVSAESSLQKMVRMVQDAEKNKAPMQRIVDQWATWLVPIALVIAVAAYLFTSDIVRAVTVLVVFCPCALALATPTSIVAAIGQATKHGVLIKSGDALEAMGKVDCIAFDKTGTLTHGNLVVSDIISVDDSISRPELLFMVASAESKSEHPLAKAIVLHAKAEGVTLAQADAFEMLPGKGIVATVAGKSVIAGNLALLQENGVALPDAVQPQMQALRKQGKAVILAGVDGNCVGLLALSDILRDEAATMVAELQKAGTQVVLLTGDHAQTAHHFAQQVGIGTVHAELLPDEKVNFIADMQSAGHKVCMIGDGINDAPALKTADVGVSMGSMGSDIAIDASDIALMGDDIAKIPYLKRLSNATIKTIKFNISMSMLINFVAITLSVLGLLNPITGALVHNAGSVLVVLNAALLYDRKYD